MSDSDDMSAVIDADWGNDLPDSLFAADAEGAARLTVSVDHWEGPLDLLLTLARSQKVDLREISILALVEQYLDYIQSAKALKLEIAADYLVMAAWLAYLKSGLLLPRDPDEIPSPEDIALRLQLRLQRLAAMREAAARLFARDVLGRDVFARGKPEGLRTITKPAWQCRYFDLLQSYGQVQARTAPVLHVVQRRAVMTLEAALERIGRLVGVQLDWAMLESFLPDGINQELRRSALASSFVAALELARKGRVELQQDAAFAPLYLRRAASVAWPNAL